ncbi:hypothetical protein T265_13465, partial [Opisthorchis viverrini]
MFTVSQQSYKGTVVGTVQAIQQLKENEDAVASAICSYQIQPLEAPFSIDRYVPLIIHVIKQEGPVFDQPSYMFTVSQQSYKGTVVGTVQAIQQLKENEDAVASAICSYQIQPLEAPFSIDRY